MKQKVLDENFVAVGFTTEGNIGLVSHYRMKAAAIRCADYYRRHYPSAKAMTYDEFVILLKNEYNERMQKRKET